MLLKVNSSDQTLSLIQDNIDNALIPLQNSPLSGGQILASVHLTNAVDNLINHSLGYAPTQILALVPNVDTRIWSPTTATLSNSNVSRTQINLRCSTACVVSVWVR